MRERGHRLRFTLESRQALGIRGEQFRQDLDRDVAIELVIARPIHLSHATGADGAEDFVRAESRAWWEGHRVGAVIIWGNRVGTSR